MRNAVHQPFDDAPYSGEGQGDVVVQEIHLTPADPDGIGEEVHTTSKCWCEPIQANFYLGLLKGIDRVYFHREYSEVRAQSEGPREESNE